MASATETAAFFVGVMWLGSLPKIAYSAAPAAQFIVEGDIFCEVCRLDFVNRLSEPMPGAKVKLQCKGEEANNITYSLEGETDEKGHYRLTAEGDHGEENCEVTLVRSSRPDCDEIPNEGWALKPSARITLTKNSGFHDNVRKANPLGFLKKEPKAECTEFYKELDISPSSNDQGGYNN